MQARGVCLALALLAGCGGGGFEGSEAEQAFLKAEEIRGQGRPDLALEFYERSLRLHDDQPRVHVAAALCLGALGRQGEARLRLEEAVARFPDDPSAALNLGFAYLRLDRLQGAQERFAAAEALKPADPTPAYWIGRTLQRRATRFAQAEGPDAERLGAAAEAYRRSLELDPGGDQAGETHFRLAEVQRDLGDSAEALASLERALAVAPSHAPAWGLLSELHGAAARWEEASSAASEASRLDPTNPEFAVLVARSLRELGQPAEALELLHGVLMRRPALARGHLERSLALEALGRGADAERARSTHGHWAGRERALVSTRLEALTNPEDAGKILDLALGLLELGRLAEARVWFERALELVPDSPVGLYSLARIQLQGGERQAARSTLERAISAQPGEHKTRLLLARILAGDGDLVAARGQLERAVEAAPSDPEVHVQMALVLGKQKDLTGAEAAFLTALEADPYHVPALLGLGGLRQDQGQTEAAIELWERVLQLDPYHVEAAALLARVRAGD